MFLNGDVRSSVVTVHIIYVDHDLMCVDHDLMCVDHDLTYVDQML